MMSAGEIARVLTEALPYMRRYAGKTVMKSVHAKQVRRLLPYL